MEKRVLLTATFQLPNSALKCPFCKGTQGRFVHRSTSDFIQHIYRMHGDSALDLVPGLHVQRQNEEQQPAEAVVNAVGDLGEDVKPDVDELNLSLLLNSGVRHDDDEPGPPRLSTTEMLLAGTLQNQPSSSSVVKNRHSDSRRGLIEVDDEGEEGEYEDEEDVDSCQPNRSMSNLSEESKGVPIFYDDQEFEYHIRNAKNDLCFLYSSSVSLRCSQRTCKGNATLTPAGVVLRRMAHNHDPERGKRKAREILSKVKTEKVAGVATKERVDELIAQADEDAAKLLPQRRTLYRAMQQVREKSAGASSPLTGFQTNVHVDVDSEAEEGEDKDDGDSCQPDLSTSYWPEESVSNKGLPIFYDDLEFEYHIRNGKNDLSLLYVSPVNLRCSQRTCKGTATLTPAGEIFRRIAHNHDPKRGKRKAREILSKVKTEKVAGVATKERVDELIAQADEDAAKLLPQRRTLYRAMQQVREKSSGASSPLTGLETNGKVVVDGEGKEVKCEEEEDKDDGDSCQPDLSMSNWSEESVSNKGLPIFYDDLEFEYHIRNGKNDLSLLYVSPVSLRCSQRTCKGSATLLPCGELFKRMGHNHAPKIGARKARELLSKVKTEQFAGVSTKESVDQLMAEADEDVVKLLPKISTLRRTVQRLREKPTGTGFQTNATGGSALDLVRGLQLQRQKEEEEEQEEEQSAEAVGDLGEDVKPDVDQLNLNLLLNSGVRHDDDEPGPPRLSTTEMLLAGTLQNKTARSTVAKNRQNVSRRGMTRIVDLPISEFCPSGAFAAPRAGQKRAHESSQQQRDAGGSWELLGGPSDVQIKEEPMDDDDEDDEIPVNTTSRVAQKTSTPKMFDGIQSVDEFGAVFPDEESVVMKMMEEGLLREDVCCNNCGKQMALRKRKTNLAWRCRYDKAKDCSSLSVRTNSFFARSALPLTKCMKIVYLWAKRSTNKNMSAKCGISPQTAVDWRNFLREICQKIELTYEPLGGDDDDVIDVEETALHTRKYGRGESEKDKDLTWILGAISRKTKRVKAVIVPDRTPATLVWILRVWIRPGSEVHSDLWNGSAKLDESFTHESLKLPAVFHKKRGRERDSDDGGTANCLASFWQRLKQPLKDGCLTSETLLPSYVSESVVRQNEGDALVGSILAAMKTYV